MKRKKMTVKQAMNSKLRFPKDRVESVLTPPKLRDNMVDTLCSIDDVVTQLTVSQQAHRLLCSLLVVGQQDVNISRGVLKCVSDILEDDIKKFARYEA